MQGEFKVGEWLVQPQLNLLNLGDRAVSIEPKVMDVLVCLAEKAGEVLSKKCLRQRIPARRQIGHLFLRRPAL